VNKKILAFNHVYVVLEMIICFYHTAAVCHFH